MCKKIEITKGAPTIEEFMNLFKTDKQAYEFIIKHIYPDGKVICPYCGCSDYLYKSPHQLGRYNCGNCRKIVTVFNGTMFENVNKCFKKWLYIIYASFVSRKSVSSLQLARELGMSSETILNFRKRVQVAMSNYDLQPFTDEVQMDEAYFGGSNHGRYNKTDEGVEKIKYPLFGIFETKTHRVYTCIAKRNEKGQSLTSKQIKDFIECTCKKGTTIISDEWKSYMFLDAENSGYTHKKVNHRDNQYVNEDGYTTNGIESYFGILKKIYYSTHAFFSKKWAHLYFAESDFRFNYQNWEEAIDTVLSQGVYFPRVIDIRQLGKFANKTYDLKKYKMVLPKCFDEINLDSISAYDILTCKEPIYGILKEPYLTREKQHYDNKYYSEEWQKIGFDKYFSEYKDYRNNIVNDVAYLEEMIKNASKYKDVNNITEIPRKTPRPLKDPAKVRQSTMLKSYNGLPKILQIQIKSEYPTLLRITDKQKTKEVHLRIRVLKNWYNKNKGVIEQ